MESVHVVLLDRRFNVLWWSNCPSENPFVGKPLLEFTRDQTRLREKITDLMLDNPVEEFVGDFRLYQPPDFTQHRDVTMRAKLIRIDDLMVVAAVAIFQEVLEAPRQTGLPLLLATTAFRTGSFCRI